jgi:hypothetical protein
MHCDLFIPGCLLSPPFFFHAMFLLYYLAIIFKSSLTFSLFSHLPLVMLIFIYSRTRTSCYSTAQLTSPRLPFSPDYLCTPASSLLYIVPLPVHQTRPRSCTSNTYTHYHIYRRIPPPPSIEMFYFISISAGFLFRNRSSDRDLLEGVLSYPEEGVARLWCLG